MTKRTLEDIALETALGHFLCDVLSAEDFRNIDEDWMAELDVTVFQPFENHSADQLVELISDLESSILAALIEASTK